MQKSLRLRVVVCLILLGLASGVNAADDGAHPEAVGEARAVMQRFIETFNARDESAWADTLLFPHVRVASGSVVVIEDKQTFVASTDLEQFALDNNWDFSQWDAMEVVHAGPEKVHFKVIFSRFNPQGERYATFDSLYILQKVDGRWGIRARSSFAP